MTKVSKNIKKLRNEKGMTQDTLAEKLYVSRQAISSWENGRTQPDIEMLEALAEIFGVEIEEVIYGEKRKTTLETEKTNYISTAVIVISVLGSLLVAAGLVLIFATGWEKLPKTVKGIFALLPLLAGQYFAAFVILKKRKSTPWCEGASVGWTVGVVASIALVSSIYNLAFGYVNWLIVDALLILPIIFLLDAVTPVAAYFYMVLHWFFDKADTFSYKYSHLENFKLTGSFSFVLCAITALALICAVTVFFRKKKELLKKPADEYITWLSIIALGIYTAFIFCVIDTSVILLGLLVFAICLFALSKKDDPLSSPFRLLGTIVPIVVVSVMSFSVNFYDGPMFDETKLYAMATLCFASILVSTFKSRESFNGNIFETIEFSLMCVAALTYISCIIYSYSYIQNILAVDPNADIYIDIPKSSIFFMAIRAIEFALGIVFILQGAKENKLFPINVGFITACAVVASILFGAELSLLASGLILTSFGIILLVINLRITKKKHKLLNAEAQEACEVQERQGE